MYKTDAKKSKQRDKSDKFCYCKEGRAITKLGEIFPNFPIYMILFFCYYVID